MHPAASDKLSGLYFNILDTQIPFGNASSFILVPRRVLGKRRNRTKHNLVGRSREQSRSSMLISSQLIRIWKIVRTAEV